MAKEREKELARLEAERRKHFERVQKEQASGTLIWLLIRLKLAGQRLWLGAELRTRFERKRRRARAVLGGGRAFPGWRRSILTRLPWSPIPTSAEEAGGDAGEGEGAAGEDPGSGGEEEVSVFV